MHSCFSGLQPSCLHSEGCGPAVGISMGVKDWLRLVLVSPVKPSEKNSLA